ncbi:MAG: hypothetical protein N4A65_04975 [Cohaesibacter sp.]|jgi:hypothetical protein|nr:hypothetical protein [Cohaesibacter sp.]
MPKKVSKSVLKGGIAGCLLILAASGLPAKADLVGLSASGVSQKQIDEVIERNAVLRDLTISNARLAHFVAAEIIRAGKGTGSAGNEAQDPNPDFTDRGRYSAEGALDLMALIKQAGTQK